MQWNLPREVVMDDLQNQVHASYAKHHNACFVLAALPATQGTATRKPGEPDPSDLFRGPIALGGGGALAIMRDKTEFRFWFFASCGSEMARDEFIALSRRIGATLSRTRAIELGMMADGDPVAVWWMFMLRRLEHDPHFVVTTATYQAIIDPFGAMVQAQKMLDLSRSAVAAMPWLRPTTRRCRESIAVRFQAAH
jgi:hypothetical protein